MAYTTKKQDHEKRKDQEGSYSLYNHLYSYLMSNYEPCQDLTEAKPLLYGEAIKYNTQGGKAMTTQEINRNIRAAIKAFRDNNGQHGDTAKNFGKIQGDELDSIKWSLQDLKW